MSTTFMLVRAAWPHQHTAPLSTINPHLIHALITRRLETRLGEKLVQAIEGGDQYLWAMLLNELESGGETTQDVLETIEALGPDDPCPDEVFTAVCELVAEKVARALTSGEEQMVILSDLRRSDIDAPATVVPVVYTGGTSWGDSPTEAFDAVNWMARLGLFDAPLTSVELRQAETLAASWRAELGLVDIPLTSHVRQS